MAKRTPKPQPIPQLDLTEADHCWLVRAYHAGAGCWYKSATGQRRMVRLQALGLVNDLGSISGLGLEVMMRAIREAGL